MAIVKDYMVRTLISVSDDDQISEAIRIMYRADMSVLAVVNHQNQFLGTIYSKNILKNILPEKYGFLDTNRLLYEINQAADNLSEIEGRQVKEYMSTRTSAVQENDKMYKVADVMLDNRESVLFVINNKGNLRGHISRAELLYYLLKVANKQDT